MTQQTNYQLPVPELTQAGAFFANLGLECPWVGEDAWCDLGQGEVIGQIDAYGGRHRKWVSYLHCPPAVAAAVVWFATQVSFRFDRDDPFIYEGTCAEEQAARYILGVWQAMGGYDDN